MRKLSAFALLITACLLGFNCKGSVDDPIQGEEYVWITVRFQKDVLDQNEVHLVAYFRDPSSTIDHKPWGPGVWAQRVEGGIWGIGLRMPEEGTSGNYATTINSVWVNSAGLEHIVRVESPGTISGRISIDVQPGYTATLTGSAMNVNLRIRKTS